MKFEHWFVTINIFPYQDSATAQEVSPVHFWGQSLLISCSSLRPSPTVPILIFTKCMDAAPHPLWLQGIHVEGLSRCHPHSTEKSVVETDGHKEWPLSESDDDFSGDGMGLYFHAGMTVSCLSWVYPYYRERLQAGSRNFCLPVSEVIRSYGSYSKCDIFGAPVHETI